ncbi:hypothetical protein GGR25_004171 [Kaistia hirudinis]|uniref:Uncharacterized protein n=1 Tax=Kaistia hirudinis TaxID=1293440 RepID=A0A840AVL9_9HYPH|nr:hypothetical protein [Kaistia hirudinis]MBB3933107.1 hypothetical protein [Kaistia hirudinis]
MSWVVSRDTCYVLWLPLLIALASSIITIKVNHAVRIGRVKRIYAFSKGFAIDPSPCPKNGETPVPLKSYRPDIRSSPSMELVVSKYTIDLDEAMPEDHFIRLEELLDARSAGSPAPYKSKPTVNYLVNPIRCFDMPVNRQMAMTALPFVGIVMIGWIGAIDTARKIDPFGTLSNVGAQFGGCALYPPMLSIAFLGAYASAMTILVRAVCLFDLSATTFMRATLQIVTSLAAAIVLWNCLRGLTLDHVCGTSPGKVLYPFVFAIGFVPDAGLNYVLAWISNREWAKASVATSVVEAQKQERAAGFAAGLASFLKLTDNRFNDATRSVPLDAIDGIDFFTRFRLAAAGVYEVQNLAVANPILLHVETPYGIYQTIDWVAQAQLCTVVGLERFLILRQHNIRTIFDLERAVLSLKSTQAFRRAVGSILMATTQISRDIESLGKIKMRNPDSPDSAPLDMDAFDRLMFEESLKKAKYRVKLPLYDTPTAPCGYHVRVEQTPASTTQPIMSFDIIQDGTRTKYKVFEVEDEDATIKHMVRVVMDDLHVIRLRQIWETISRRIGGDAATLDDSEDTILGA